MSEHCEGALNIEGEHYGCVEPPDHGGPCRNPEVQTVWISPRGMNP